MEAFNACGAAIQAGAPEGCDLSTPEMNGCPEDVDSVRESVPVLATLPTD